MPKTTSEQNKALVLEAFDILFNKRDYTAAERYWSPDYIQHSAHIAPGREGLFNLIKSVPPTLKYEPGMIVAEGDLCGNSLGRSFSPSSNSSWCICFTDPCASRRKPSYLVEGRPFCRVVFTI